jgi:hypothetical protein
MEWPWFIKAQWISGILVHMSHLITVDSLSCSKLLLNQIFNGFVLRRKDIGIFMICLLILCVCKYTLFIEVDGFLVIRHEISV